tara:strand:- start:536 stop:1060 length:525 start_codon:yes stop_codon:yes gene_type:complete
MIKLLNGLDWSRGVIRIFGREIDEPRITTWCGDVSYTYSNRNLLPRPWPKNLVNIRDALDHLLTSHEIQTQQGLNHCLLNYYRSGTDSMGWHRDNESELGRHPVIASLSLGEPRRFRLKSRINKATSPVTFDLGHGDLLVMYGTTQIYWEHALAKTKKTIGGRMNLTFRSVGLA